MNKKLFFLLSLCISCAYGYTQTIWFTPQEYKPMPVSGRGWNQETGQTYHRLPDRFRSGVRSPLWNLSMNGSGLYLDFSTDASDIIVKYTVTEQKWLSNVGMMAKSGIDLYKKNKADGWDFCSCFGHFNFGNELSDTIVYHYQDLTVPSKGNAVFRLYLPLYNTVSTLRVGIPRGKSLRFLSPDESRPIVVYGTSIAQGASASRPGMSWVNILQRHLGIPVYNLGFSGNGRLESEIFRALGELKNARLFIIDCMPNMDSKERVDSIVPRLIRGVRHLRSKTDAPILLVEHGGYANERTQNGRAGQVKLANARLHEAYMMLAREGVKRLEYLSKDEIGMSQDDECQVDGVHPADTGMRRYADAYRWKIREILPDK